MSAVPIEVENLNGPCSGCNFVYVLNISRLWSKQTSPAYSGCFSKVVYRVLASLGMASSSFGYSAGPFTHNRLTKVNKLRESQQSYYQYLSPKQERRLTLLLASISSSVGSELMKGLIIIAVPILINTLSTSSCRSLLSPQEISHKA